jgi:Transglutaminase-like superfamily
MTAIAKAARLPGADRVLLVQALVSITIARLGLLVLPLATVRRIVRAITRAASRLPMENRRALDRIIWAVAAAGKRAPIGTTCLASALAGQALLDRHGYSTLLRIGVKRNETGAFAAHAWLEHEGKVIVGGSTDIIGTYTTMPEWEHLIV